MALTSPGVEVTIIDQSQYLPAPGGTVPLVVFATAQNKANPSGTGVAPGTTAANAGKLYQVTSQRDLVDLYGVPFFYTTTAGTPIQGYELNEYGLLAAYSLLGSTNRCYTLRADIDLSSLVGSVSRPTTAPENGTYWLNSVTSSWGIFEWNATTSSFTAKTPIVITDTASISGGLPLNSIGNIGDYAVNATLAYPSGNQQYFLKLSTNTWSGIGRGTWFRDIPTIQGTISNPTLTAANTFDITVAGLFTTTITVPASTNNTVAGVATAINNKGITWLTAGVVSGKLNIYSSQPTNLVGNATTNIVISAGTGTVLDDLGIEVGTYYQPAVTIGTSAQMPLWSSSQTYPHPTGSVWLKVGSSGLGYNPVISEYVTTTGSFQNRIPVIAPDIQSVNATLDSTGGQTIPVGTIAAIYPGFTTAVQKTLTPIFLFERTTLGATVAVGDETNFVINLNFTLGSALLYVQVSIPNSDTLSSTYTVTIPDSCTPTQFVTAWSAAAIDYTTASVTTDGAVLISHTQGGDILLNDLIQTAGANQGFSAGILTQAGFIADTTPNTLAGEPVNISFQVNQDSTTSALGSGAILSVSNTNGVYTMNSSGVANGGTQYAVGDTITVLGANLGGVTTTNNLVVRVVEIAGGGATGAATVVTFVSGTAASVYNTQITNWSGLTFTANEGAPVGAPVNGQNWFYSTENQVDIMVNTTGGWVGYRNTNYDSTGFPTATGSNTTDPNGPIVSASEPTLQSDGTALVYGDIWIDTSDLEVYPIINRWESVSGIDQWVTLDNADQTSSNGVLFADARWSSSGAINPVDDPIPTIVSLLTSDYLDLDSPSPSIYPVGMLLFNTRRSGYNVKEFTTNYFTSINYPNAGAYDAGDPTNTANLPLVSYTWVSASGLQSNGSPYMGRQAQREMVVKSLRSVIDTNNDIRDEDNFFNLMATPAYPELQPNMVVLNADRGETGYIIGDTPMRLPANATAIQAWATNAAGATSTGEAGCVTRNTYLGLFYPSGITSDLSGNLVAVPPSHMMLRTFIRNDAIAYPWLAAAGTRRGNIDNATNIGYIDATTGEFVTTKTSLGIRDVLYINFINPLVFFTGVGLLNYGNKTSFNSSSALDRVNVARLIAYVRRQLTLAARPFVFEPNDALTRNQIAGVVQTLMVDLVAKRGIYDYLVVCDESNNTPARIDRNELWIDVALEPVKAAEFIYIPVRVLNTGEIKGL
jgi:hypothetical protein